MPIDFACNHCGENYEVSDDVAGQQFVCALCGKSSMIPAIAVDEDTPLPKRKRPDRETTSRQAIEKDTPARPEREEFIEFGTGEGLTDIDLPRFTERSAPSARRDLSAIRKRTLKPAEQPKDIVETVRELDQIEQDQPEGKWTCLSLRGVFIFVIAVAVLLPATAPLSPRLPSQKIPASISLSALVEKGPGANAHVQLTDFRFATREACVVNQAGMWIPVYPSIPSSQVQRVNTVILLQNETDPATLDQLLQSQTVSGVIAEPPPTGTPFSESEFKAANPTEQVRGAWVVRMGEPSLLSWLPWVWRGAFLAVAIILIVVSIRELLRGLVTGCDIEVHFISPDTMIEYVVSMLILFPILLTVVVPDLAHVPIGILLTVAALALMRSLFARRKKRNDPRMAKSMFACAVALGIAAFALYFYAGERMSNSEIADHIAAYQSGVSSN